MKISELPVASVQEIANDGTIIVNDVITNAETGEESILTKQISLKEAIQGIGGGSGAETSYTAGQNITIENGVISADLTDYARKQDLIAAVKYKGTVADYANLPFSGQEVGDMYNITNADTMHQIKAGDNVVWTGTEWDNYGGTVDLSGKQDTLTAGTGIEINNNIVSATGYEEVNEPIKTQFWNFTTNEFEPSGPYYLPWLSQYIAVLKNIEFSFTPTEGEEYEVNINEHSYKTVAKLGTNHNEFNGDYFRLEKNGFIIIRVGTYANGVTFVHVGDDDFTSSEYMNGKTFEVKVYGNVITPVQKVKTSLLQPMVGASTAVAGTAGIVPAPAIADKDKFLKGDGTWAEISTNNGNDYVAGEGIQISNNTISLIPPVYNGASYLYAADGSVSWNLIGNIFNAGTGIYISDGTISIDLNAGDGISIEDNTISVASNTSLELPNFQPSSDYHKVLTVIGNDIDWVSLDDNNSNRLIPYHYDSDAGKVLTIDYQGEAIWDTISILPDYSNNNFELLAVNSTGGLVWTHLGDLYKDENGNPGDEGAILVASASGQLPHWEFLIPQHDERDAGKVLTVQDDGTLAWELPSSN